MKQLTIGFSTDNNSIISKLIRWWLGTTFSHTYLYFKLNEFEQYTIFQAVGSGLQFVSETTFLKTNTVINEFIISAKDEKYSEILNKCHNASGRKYGYLQNVGIVLADLLKLKKNIFRRDDNCSEWVAECILTIDPKAFNKDLNLITPLDIYNYLLRNKYGKISKN